MTDLDVEPEAAVPLELAGVDHGHEPSGQADAERRQLGSQVALVAKPLRALMDLVAFRKLQWQGLAWLTEGMRIDPQNLRTITREDIETLLKVYKHIRTNELLRALASALDK